MSEERKGIPYSVLEARLAVQEHKGMDIYHKELMLFLCDRVESLEKQLGNKTTEEITKPVDDLSH